MSSIEIFYSYSHRDEALRDELEKHLTLLKRQGYISTWHDRRIVAGQEWVGEIDNHLNTAQIILLLVSSDFLASDYCYGVEVKRAVERHEREEARVIPIILRPVYWQGAPFGKLQVLPKDAKPITQWNNIDEAFLEITLEILRLIKELRLSFKTKEEWLSEGKLLRNSKSYEEALLAYEQAILLDPTFADSWKGKGWAFYHLKCYDEALATFEQSIRLNLTSADSWKGKGWTLYRLKHYDEALAAFEQSIRLNLTSADSWKGKGWTLYRLKHYNKALAAFEQVLRFNPDPYDIWDAWNGRGWTLYRLSSYDEALAAFEQALHFDPDSIDSWDGKALTLSKLNRSQEAEHAYEKVRQLRSR